MRDSVGEKALILLIHHRCDLRALRGTVVHSDRGDQLADNS